MRNAWILLLFSLAWMACDKNNKPDGDNDDLPPISDTTTVLGYGILGDFAGAWNGPVTSTTALGSYPEWIVDFRPISASQLSSKAELDTVNNILMGFFIAKDKDRYVMVFRNGGGFAGLQRISYAKCDSSYSNATERYYRFSDYKAGTSRVYAEFRFRNDSVYMQSFTNKYNSLSAPTLHMQWSAKRVDTTAVQASISHFNFPQKQVVKDFATTFDSLTEAVFYGLQNDPYPQDQHPYLGEATVACSFGSAVQTQPGAKVILIITTQPLFNGLQYNAANLKYRSRYVLLTGAQGSTYVFNTMHPGSYYLNAIYDTNGDLTPQSGEYLQFPFDKPFTLSAEGTVNVPTEIGFQIP